MTPLKCTTLLLLTIFLIQHTSAANILCLMGVASHSHQLWGNVLFKALASRGHQLTVVAPNVPTEPMENITFIHLEETYNTIMKHFEKEMAGSSAMPSNSFMSMVMWYKYQMTTTKGILASEGFQTAIELKATENANFDLIIFDSSNGPTGLLNLAHLYPDAPIVGISAFTVFPEVFELARSGASNPAMVPYFTTLYGEQMNYWQRIYNTVHYVSSHFFKHYVVYPVISSMYSQNAHVQQAKLPLNKVNELKNRIKVLLINSHPSMDYAQPIPLNVIQVGGMQIVEPQTLPDDLLKFIESSDKGSIFMSLGTNLPIEVLGMERIEAILKVIRRLPKYNFLWKVENGNLIKDPPKNLYISSWFSQNSILAHTKVKAFFTHGGRMSLQEATYYGVPVIAVPMMLDQFNNAHRAASRGAGIHLEFGNFNEATFFNALTAILEQPNYTKRMQELSISFRNQPNRPLNSAVWWVEQVLSHPQAFEHLVPHTGGELCYFVTNSLDIITLVVIFIVMLFVNGYIIIRQTIQSFKKTKRSVKTEKVAKKLKEKVEKAEKAEKKKK